MAKLCRPQQNTGAAWPRDQIGLPQENAKNAKAKRPKSRGLIIFVLFTPLSEILIPIIEKTHFYELGLREVGAQLGAMNGIRESLPAIRDPRCLIRFSLALRAVAQSSGSCSDVAFRAYGLDAKNADERSFMGWCWLGPQSDNPTRHPLLGVTARSAHRWRPLSDSRNAKLRGGAAIRRGAC